MNTRFIHIGDIHLKSSHERHVDRLRALDQIIDANTNRQELAAWLVPGDVFDTRSAAQDRNDAAERFQRMAAKAPVVVIPGNHDLPGDLDIFAKLKAEWPIYVVNRPQVITIPLATGHTAAIFCLPYPHRAGLVAAGVPSESLVDAARQALDVIFMNAAHELNEAKAHGRITLAIAHVNIGGAVMSSGQPSIGKEIELDPALISRLGDIYFGCNHVHRAQEIGGAIYAGSICRLDWGETEEKRYLTVSYEDRRTPGPVHDWGYTVESHPVDIPPRYDVRGDLTREGFDWGLAGSSTAGPLAVEFPEIPASFEGAEVRVRYRYNAAEKSALDEALVRAPFEGAKRLELDPIAERSRAARAPEVAAAATLDAKVEAFVRRSGVPWTGALEAKLALLQQPDGAAFLTTVQNNLSERQAIAPMVASTAGLGAESPVGSGKELTGVRL